MTIRSSRSLLRGKQLGACALCLLASSCCQYRERALRNALQPYMQVIKERVATTGRCPPTLDELGVPLRSGLRQDGNRLLGFGGTAYYSVKPDGTCELGHSGFSFCGVCRWKQAAPAWQCYH